MPDEIDDFPDENRVTRDYTLWRLEMLERGDLEGCTESDLRDLSTQFHSAQLKVLFSIGQGRRKSECEVSVTFDSLMSRVKGKLLALTRSKEVKPKVSDEPQNQPQSSMAKLPKISVKQFDGEMDNWLSFIELFNSLIHHRENLSNVEKLHYLLASVHGTAYELIKNYPLTGQSYLTAYETLERYYNRRWQIASTYYEKLVSCVPIKGKTGPELERVYRIFSENLLVLEKLGLPDKNFLLLQLIWGKLDAATRQAFQLEHDSDDIPNFEAVQKFIEKHHRAMNATHSGIGLVPSRPALNARTKVTPPQPRTSFIVEPVCCPCCSGPHSLVTCQEFLELDAHARFDLVKAKGLCILCFSSSHTVRNCRSARCSKCNYSHNPLLHFGLQLDMAREDSLSLQSNNDTSLTSVGQHGDGGVLFSTAVILVRAADGGFRPVRVLLDCASACNFVTKSCAESLGLILHCSTSTVSGIGHTVAEPRAIVSLEIASQEATNFVTKLNAYVLPSICSAQPALPVDSSRWAHIQELLLADPNFARPGPIDMLLNADIFASSLLPGLVRGEVNQPTALNTVFGWILLGGFEYEPVPNSQMLSTNRNCLFITNLSLDSSIRKFWELENVVAYSEDTLSKEDQQCENYFIENHRRTDEGRFVVPLPFVDPRNKPIFTNSRVIALKRFAHLERKLAANVELKKAYVAFMDDYAACHHMEETEAPSENVGSFYYIPHHGILRPDSVSTPLRVVFDASAKDAVGVSLNDTLLAGQKLQTNIFDVLLRFRWHSVVFTGDIKQMYRQILVPDNDAEYQRILWRPSPVGPVKDYKLRTVTYGVSSAPYQALRTISQLARKSASCYPRGSDILSRDIYVDDIVTGADSVEQAVTMKAELTKILSSGGFHLRKWASNCEEFLADVPAKDLYSENFKEFADMTDVSLKILGLRWLPQADCFTFKVQTEERRSTKRIILSEISRIYDPIGLLAPITFFVKYLIQVLWTAGVAWDDDVPKNVHSEWSKFKSQLSSLATISIPRRMVGTYANLEFHGFCDASERGYCAVIYCRVVDADGLCSVALCCAKSKVAPLRKLSIPRLELQAAVLLSDLMIAVIKAISPFQARYTVVAWSDSTVALAWIKSCSSRWQTFVANRVSHIQENIAPDCWRHVPTADNPADIGSRGLLPKDIVDNNLWWKGPSWLSKSSDNWPQPLPVAEPENVLPETRLVSLIVSNEPNILFDQLLRKFSSLWKLQRVLAHVLRFVHNATHIKNKIVGALDVTEIQKAFIALIRYVQNEMFANEIELLRCNNPNSLPKSFRKLSPFIDELGLVRVGGLLAHATLAFDVKHPLLLPRQHRLTFLIIEAYHQRYLHPGVQTLQNILAQSFWILSPKRAIRAVVSGCVKCFRVNPRPALTPEMGHLPPSRIGQLKPFSNAAIDFGGPFDLALGRGRGARTFKGYVCVFVCTATKAIHLEVASEMTSEAFLAALKRFIARRGRCSQLFSDQGRNFVGASNYLSSLMRGASECENIRFSFSPPGSPHFNGLAEAGIKSVKTHISRVVGLQRLTYEEFNTILVQIEAVLNSRPLTPISSDARDLSVLTPGHFLTLEPLSTLPEENLVAQNVSPLHRWKLLQKMHQDFWKRWHIEYIHTLQQKNKWNQTHPNVCVGTLVLIIDEQSSPLKWRMGRIEEVHPGTDGICRVVTLRTATGRYQRPVVKLCPLPIAQQTNTL